MDLAQARKRKPVDVTEWFCWLFSQGVVGVSSQVVAAGTAVTWHCLYHGSKELVQHLNRAAHLVAACHCEFLRHLRLFRSFATAEAGIPLLCPYLKFLSLRHLMSPSAGVCSAS